MNLRGGKRRKSSSRKCGDKTDLGIFNFLRSIFEENWRGGRGWVAVGGMAELHMESERESNSSIPFIHSFFRLTDGTPTLSILPSIPRTLSNRSRGNFSSYPQPKSVCISSQQLQLKRSAAFSVEEEKWKQNFCSLRGHFNQSNLNPHCTDCLSLYQEMLIIKLNNN